MPVRSDNKDENFVYLIMRIIVGLVAVAYVAFAVIFKQPCDIDKQYLSCRITGTWADWLGSILFVGACLSISGALNWVYKVKADAVGVIIGVAGVAGILLVWNL